MAARVARPFAAGCAVASICKGSRLPTLTTKKLRRGAHRSVRALNADIRAWIQTWNDNPQPFVWTKTADQILESIARYCERITVSRH